MCIPLTPVLRFIVPVIIEVNLQCFIESVILRDISKPTSRAELSRSKPLYLKAPKRVQFGSA